MCSKVRPRIYVRWFALVSDGDLLFISKVRLEPVPQQLRIGAHAQVQETYGTNIPGGGRGGEGKTRKSHEVHETGSERTVSRRDRACR
mgnify:FL=1